MKKIKTKKNLNKWSFLKMECEKCKESFPEDELDIVDGKWLCRECEKENNIFPHPKGRGIYP